MGDYNGTVPTFLAGELPDADKFTELSNLALAITGPWTTYSSTVTNLTIGNGSATAKYRRTGKTVDFRFRFELGTTSAIGTAPSFTLPFAPSVDYKATPFDRIGSGNLEDISVPANRVADPLFIGGSTVQINHMNATPTSATTAAGAPWAWAAGDVIEIHGTYYTD